VAFPGKATATGDANPKGKAKAGKRAKRQKARVSTGKDADEE